MGDETRPPIDPPPGGILRLAEARDLDAIAEILNREIRANASNFRLRDEPLDEIAARFRAGRERYPWLVFEDAEGIEGFANAGPFKDKAAYGPLCESSVYLRDGARGRGTGARLYAALLLLLELQGYRGAAAWITLPNAASEALHRRLGFARLGVLERAGFKLGRWWDVALWRRSLGGEGTAPPMTPRPVEEVFASRAFRDGEGPSRVRP